MYKFPCSVPVFLPLLAACATAPVPLATGPFADITPSTALAPSALGQRVRWGGEIITVKPLRTETCFEVLSRPLDSQGRPREVDRSHGRFLACAKGFYDPAAYPVGRELTMIGTLEQALLTRVGEYAYRVPSVRAHTIHLWAERVDVYPVYDPFWYGPWYPWRCRYSRSWPGCW
jgi:outer membrane lipoprotein